MRLILVYTATSWHLASRCCAARYKVRSVLCNTELEMAFVAVRTLLPSMPRRLG